jgi:hypothetical protein
MFFKKICSISTLTVLALSPVLAQAESDPTYEAGVLTMPRVIAGGELYENVRLQLDLAAGTVSLLEASTPRARFTSKTNGIDEILIDNIAQRTWVNGSHACKINSNTKTDNNAEHPSSIDAKAHCASLDFGGYQDWRAPTSAEISEMIIHADMKNVKLNYRNPNCQFMAASDGFVKTENTNEPGKIVDSAVNSGTRCVR